MKINFVPVNKGETYCCSLRKLKEVFKNTSVVVCFAHGDSVFHKGLQHPIYRYVDKYVKGKVLVCIECYLRQIDPLICFYRLKVEECSTEIINQFEECFLPKIYDFYTKQLNNQDITGKTKLMLVELLNGKLKLHETTL